MHLLQGKKVRFLPLGDVNLRPIPSRRGLLEDSPYRAVGVVVCHATSHDLVLGASRDSGMSYGHFRKTRICSCNIYSAVHAALNAWVTLEE
jgi:hypothetical protein